MEAVVKNVLFLFAVKKAVIKLKYPTHIPFSISTDASNKGNRKLLPLAVRLFDFEDKKRLKLLRVKDYLLEFYKESNKSLLSIFKTITFTIEFLSLYVQNITAFGADNVCVNYEKIRNLI